MLRLPGRAKLAESHGVTRKRRLSRENQPLARFFAWHLGGVTSSTEVLFAG